MLDYAKFYPQEDELRTLLEIHSRMVAELSLKIAEAHPELNADKEFIYEAAMLHDIGIKDCNAPSIHCFGTQPYICHGVIGSDRLRKAGLPVHALVCERHTGSGLSKDEIIANNLPLPHREMLPVSIEEKIICYADKFFSKSGDPTKIKSFDKVYDSLKRHGAKPLERFLQLHALLNIRKEDKE